MEPQRTSTSTPVRVGLGLLAAVGAEVGVWAALWPRAFYDHFPGAGRVWVSVDGPYNQHLVRDVGQYNLAFAVLLVMAAVVADRRLTRGALVAYLVAAIPHLAYHLGHLRPYSTADKVGNVGSLSVAVIVPIILLAWDAKSGAGKAVPRS